MRNPHPDPYLEQLQLLRRLAWLEAQKAQRSANRLTLLTNHLDLLLRELSATAGECDPAETPSMTKHGLICSGALRSVKSKAP